MQIQDDDDADDAFLRSLMLPEEDRRLLTATPWTGGFRWFRTTNVVDLETYRRRRDRKARTNV
jgi:hypothetical protein